MADEQSHSDCGDANRPRRRTVLGPEDRARVAELYASGLTSTVLARQFGIHFTTVLEIAREAGCVIRNSGRVHTLDVDAFRRAGPETSYWVGFLMADGCVRDRPHGQTLQVALKAEDAGHLEKLRAFLACSNPIVWGNARGHRYARVAVHSAEICDSLRAYGVVPRKSLDCCVTGLENDRDFWRGVVDGDGSLQVSKRNQPVLRLTGSKPLLEQFRAYAIGCYPPYRGSLFPVARAYVVPMTGAAALRLTEILYRDASVALERKAAVAAEILRRFSTERFRPHAELSRALLEAMRAELGSWSAVGRKLGMSLQLLNYYRKRRPEAEID